MLTSRGRPSWRPTDPEVAVFVSGVASMGLEILAGRIVAPQFGSSIYTWGSIIGVFLAALSLGYHQGGKRAASHATQRRVNRLLLATAAYVAVLIFAGDLLLRSTAGLPLPSRFASLPAVTLLFGPPTYFLGFVSPYAAELSGTEDVGEASGRMYAVGTVGSIVGAFGTTFLLVPSLGVDQIEFAFGALLVGTVVALEWPGRLRDAGPAILVSLLLVGSVGAGSLGYSIQGEVVYETQTAYQELRVVDRGDTRTLYLDGQRHSAMDLDDPTRHVFDYTRYFHLPCLMVDDPDEIDRVLFVGGGGFSGPKRFVEEYNATVDVAEIDPAVVDAARDYFALEAYEETGRLNVHVGDGRQFLRETNHTYDLIVLDAYKKDKVPFQLTTVEFARLAKGRLSDDGVLFANLISAPSGPGSEFYRAQYRTVNRAFPQAYGFRTSLSDAVQNVELVATRNGTRLTEAQLLARNDRRAVGLDLADEVRSSMPPPETDDVPVLRDDRAPVGSLLDSMAGQRYVVEEAERGADTDEGTNASTPTSEPGRAERSVPSPDRPSALVASDTPVVARPRAVRSPVA